MKKTSKEFMEWLGLKVGDRVKMIVDNETIIGVVKEDKCANYGYCVCTEQSNYTLGFIVVNEIDYKILPAPKRVGELECQNDIDCEDCPFEMFCSLLADYNYTGYPLYQVYSYICNITDGRWDKEILDLLKARLDKEVEE